eukprot:gene57904-79333_t
MPVPPRPPNGMTMCSPFCPAAVRFAAPSAAANPPAAGQKGEHIAIPFGERGGTGIADRNIGGRTRTWRRKDDRRRPNGIIARESDDLVDVGLEFHAWQSRHQCGRVPLEFCDKDNGPGVPEDLLPNLFDPFVTTKPTGSGLGLALVAKIVGDHGGIIECESQPRKTTFRVLLPMFNAAKTFEPSNVDVPATSTILVADDDTAIRTVLNQALSRAGYKTVRIAVSSS